MEGRIIDIPRPGPPSWLTDPWNPQQIRYFDGRQWTNHTAQPVSATPFPIPPVSADGYPFGEPTLFLRPIRSGFGSDVRCSMTNQQGQPLALIRPLGEFPFGAAAVCKLEFEVVRPNGIQLLRFTRSTGRTSFARHCLQVHDPAGNELGCLRQTNSYWQYLRTPWMSVDLEYEDQAMGTSKIRTHIPRSPRWNSTSRSRTPAVPRLHEYAVNPTNRGLRARSRRRPSTTDLIAHAPLPRPCPA